MKRINIKNEGPDTIHQSQIMLLSEEKVTALRHDGDRHDMTWCCGQILSLLFGNV